MQFNVFPGQPTHVHFPDDSVIGGVGVLIVRGRGFAQCDCGGVYFVIGWNHFRIVDESSRKTTRHGQYTRSIGVQRTKMATPKFGGWVFCFGRQQYILLVFLDKLF